MDDLMLTFHDASLDNEVEERRTQIKEKKEYYPRHNGLSDKRGICLIINNLHNDSLRCKRKVEYIRTKFDAAKCQNFGNTPIEELFSLVNNLINVKSDKIDDMKKALSNLSELFSLHFPKMSETFGNLIDKIDAFSNDELLCSQERTQLIENVDNLMKPTLGNLIQRCKDIALTEFQEKHSRERPQDQKSIRQKGELITQIFESMNLDKSSSITDKLEVLKCKYQRLKIFTSYGNDTIEKAFSLIEDLIPLKNEKVKNKLKTLYKFEDRTLPTPFHSVDIKTLFSIKEQISSYDNQLIKEKERRLKLKDKLDNDIHDTISKMAEEFHKYRETIETQIQEEYNNLNDEKSNPYLTDKKEIVNDLFKIIDQFSLYKLGAYEDYRQLKTTFSKLNYSVHYKRNLSGDKMRRQIEKLGAADHTQYDSVVLCFISHGGTNKLYGSDYCEVHMKNIVDSLSSKRAKTLRNKPKLIFVAACRGNELDVGDTECLAHSEKEDLQTVPLTNDFFFAFATYDGYLAHITKSGTFFIQSLCYHFLEYGKYCKITGLMPIINRDVRKRMEEYYKPGKKKFNVVTYCSSLSKEFKF